MKDAAHLRRPDLPRPKPGKDEGSLLFGAGQVDGDGGKVAGGVGRGREGGAARENNRQGAVQKREDEAEVRGRARRRRVQARLT